MKLIDNFLNSITMYRLVLYGLIVLAVESVLFGFLGIVSFNGWHMISSLIILLITCYGINFIFSKLFKAPTNVESSLITSLILFLILIPPVSLKDILILIIAGTLAMASKYILAINKKHIFNPAAIALVLITIGGADTSIWWIGTPSLFPSVLIFGLLVVKKIRRFRLLISFLIPALIVAFIFGTINKVTPIDLLQQNFLSWPLIFFGTIMLTEPLTIPPTKYLQMIYGIIVGCIFSSQFHFGPLYPTPEGALIIGNIFSFIVSPKRRFKFLLKEKKQIAADMYEFIFSSENKLQFNAGQYLEWTLPHSHPDSRGNRRYFTIASAPTENEIKLGVRMQSQKSSSFKSALLSMKTNDALFASQLAGDFTLSEEKNNKFVFIAGGIGITPFRSIIQYLIDTNQKKDIVLFYACANSQSFVYKDVFDAAYKKLGIKTIYVITNNKNVPPNWNGKVGYITEEIIKEEVPDYKDRVYYLSGPNAMVTAYQNMLYNLTIHKHNIMTDYFPGF